MFDLVDDVDRYPEFLPWCGGSEVLAQTDGGKTARVDINYHGVRAHFTTDNVNRAARVDRRHAARRPVPPPARRVAFRPLARRRVQGRVRRSPTNSRRTLLETLVGPVFNHIANTFIDAFVRRAQAVYGNRY